MRPDCGGLLGWCNDNLRTAACVHHEQTIDEQIIVGVELPKVDLLRGERESILD